MVHKGRDYELFIWRDLCGEYDQGTVIRTPKYCRWGGAAWTGTAITWLNANNPVSSECFRVDWDPSFIFEWDLSIPGIGDMLIQYQITFDPPARTIRADLSAVWGPHHAEADKTWGSPQLVEAVPYFLKQMDWDNRHSTTPSVWDWGIGGLTSSLRLEPQGYPWP